MNTTDPNQARAYAMISPCLKYCSQLWPTLLKRTVTSMFREGLGLDRVYNPQK